VDVNINKKGEMIMRLWSIHPKYLDRQGLLAVWREGLLAQKVLLEKTKGYKNHPQLDRFKKLKYSIDGLCEYLMWIWVEAKVRGYKFNANKLTKQGAFPKQNITITTGQLKYEWEHLTKKLDKRTPAWIIRNDKLVEKNNWKIEPHPLFKVIEGDIENWEKIKE
jgi:hypothetical protein